MQTTRLSLLQQLRDPQNSIAWSRFDKGKLVIEAAPGIEISVKDETIKVHDPQTGKDFVIKVGEWANKWRQF